MGRIYTVKAYRCNSKGDLIPSLTGQATTRRRADALAREARRRAVPGTCFGYPLVTLAIVGGETLAEWRLGKDLKHHEVEPGSTPDRIIPPMGV